MSLRERTRPGLGIIEPCLPSPAKAPPSGPGWLHEIKHDGFRIMARRDSAGVRLITRNGNDFTSRLPIIVAAVTALPARSFLIDGEPIVCDENGLAVFDLIRGHGSKTSAVLCAFDLLELDGRDLRRRPIEERKGLLAKLLHDSNLSPRCGDKKIRHRTQPALRGGRRSRVPGSVSARLRRHCEQAPRLNLLPWAVAELDQSQKPE